MSSACVEYLLYQVNEKFGKDCQEICRVLLNNEWLTLKDIKDEVGYLKSNKISEFLQMLINFNIVSFKCDGEYINSFEFNINGLLSLLRSHRYLALIEHHFNNISKLIIEEFCKVGNLYSIQIFERMKKYFSDDDWIENVALAINKLINAKILKVSPISLMKSKSMKKYSELPHIEKIKEMLLLNGSLTCGVKRSYDQMTHSTQSWDFQYCLDNERLDKLCRNAFIIEDARINLNEDAADLIEILVNLLEFGSSSCYDEPVSSGLLQKHAKSKDPNRLGDPDKFDELIYMLSQVDDIKFIEQIRNPSGNLLRVDFDRITEQLVAKIIGDQVKVIFGSDGLAIYNFLLINDHIEEKDLKQQLVITRARLEALLPAMLDRGFISKLELSRTKQYCDEPLVTLLFVDLAKATSCERETCFQTLTRLAVRRTHEENRQKPLLTKLLDMSLKDSSFQTIDGDGAISVVTEKDRDTVRRLNEALFKLDAAEIATDDTLLIFDAFLEMKTRRDNF